MTTYNMALAVAGVLAAIGVYFGASIALGHWLAGRYGGERVGLIAMCAFGVLAFLALACMMVAYTAAGPRR